MNRTLLITVVANGVNFTDGYDTLATVPMLTNLVFTGVAAYISGNQQWSSYLLIPSIPGIEEIVPLIGALTGALLSFLWFNAPPASIYMGDCGAIGIGGLIGILFIFTKTGFFFPIVGFIFTFEFISSLIQRYSYKLFKKRVFLRAPVHHHFEMKMKKKEYYTDMRLIRSKITWRFHLISIISLIVGMIVFFKVR